MLSHPDVEEDHSANVYFRPDLHLLSTWTMLTRIQQFPETLQGKVLQLFTRLQCAAQLFFPDW
jgi:hypothetical protein